MLDSLTAIKVEPHQCPLHQSILLTQRTVHLNEKSSPFISGIIYFCTFDGFFRILVKTSSELICTRLLTVHSCPFIHCTVHRGNNNVRNPFFVLIHDKCRDFRAHLNSCQLPCHSYLLLYNYHLSSLQGHSHEEGRQDCSLTWFLEINTAATEPMHYVLNTIILSFCI